MQDYLEKKLIEHEGYRSNPYSDTRGILTIGIGRNLNNGVSFDEAVFLMRNDIKHAEKQLAKNISFYNDLDDASKYVLMNMCFNLGLGGLLKFKKMLSYLAEGDKENASKEMLSSLWSKQVGRRSIELSKVMRTGELK